MYMYHKWPHSPLVLSCMHVENAELFASLIARTAQDIDTLIEALPSQEYTAERQVGWDLS